jgi:hypothetical protein
MVVLLTDLYDSKEIPWKYRTKNSGSNVIPSPFLNILAGTTPESLAASFPVSAIGGGLGSRIIFIWANSRKTKSAIPENSPAEIRLKKYLIDDLYLISRISGQYVFSADARERWIEWYNRYEELDPDRRCKDRSFNAWYSRKPTLVLKVSMLCAATRHSNMVLEWRDIEESLYHIQEVELLMGEVFRVIGRSDVTVDVDMVLQMIRERRVLGEKELRSLTYRDIDDRKFDNVIETLRKTGKITRTYRGPKGETGDIWYLAQETSNFDDVR